MTTRRPYRNTLIWLSATFMIAVLFVGTELGSAFTGPSGSGGVGSGAVAVDGANNLGVGTSTTASDTKLLVVGSSTTNSAYAFRVLKSNNNPLLLVRNDGVIGLNATIPGGASTSSVIASGDMLVNGTITANGFVGAISGNVNASNVTAGVFASGNFSFPSSLGIATSTQVSLPQALSVYGGGYISGNVGIGTTSPSSNAGVAKFLEISGSPHAGIVLTDTDGGAGKWEIWNDGGTLDIWRSGTGHALVISSSGTATFGGGSGKIDVGTIDPPYTIGGKRYATYLPAMIGVKEEVTGRTSCVSRQEHRACSYTIDFTILPEGSDLWLFAKVTDLKKHFADMTVLLTPAFDGRVWYEKNADALTLTFYGLPEDTGEYEVSYRLTAPRFDADKWPNNPENGSPGFILD